MSALHDIPDDAFAYVKQCRGEPIDARQGVAFTPRFMMVVSGNRRPASADIALTITRWRERDAAQPVLDLTPDQIVGTPDVAERISRQAGWLAITIIVGTATKIAGWW